MSFSSVPLRDHLIQAGIQTAIRVFVPSQSGSLLVPPVGMLGDNFLNSGSYQYPFSVSAILINEVLWMVGGDQVMNSISALSIFSGMSPVVTQSIASMGASLGASYISVMISDALGLSF